MNDDYQIALHHDEVLLTTLSVAPARYVEVVALLHERFPADQGFSLHIQRRREMRRILEQSPEGLRLLGVVYHHEEVPENA